MITLKEAIKEMEDLHDSLVKHYNRGGEFAKPQLEATEWAIRCMNGFLRVPINAQECVQVSCENCHRNDEKKSGRVCSLYADKVDEIRRIHEEG